MIEQRFSRHVSYVSMISALGLEIFTCMHIYTQILGTQWKYGQCRENAFVLDSQIEEVVMTYVQWLLIVQQDPIPLSWSFWRCTASNREEFHHG